MLRTISVAFLLLIDFCVAIKVKDSNYHGSNKISMTLYANTITELNGVSSIPAVFGLTAYNGVYDFSSAEGTKFLSDHNIDTVGFGATLSKLLPTGKYSLSVSSLKDWLTQGNAYSLYKKTGDYFALRSRGIRKGGSKPFLFVRNPLGYCNPYCQKVNCWNNGGTPKIKGSSSAQWWRTLITGYINISLKADPNLDIIHIWNEPDYTFWKDGKNGSYYSRFYSMIAKAVRSKWPNIKIGGPVSSVPSTNYTLRKDQSMLMWNTYIQPFIDSTVPNGLLDFIDFHAYDSNALPENLLNAIETTISYIYVKYKTYIPVAVTESNIKSVYTYKSSYQQSLSSKKEYYLKRTFPLMLSTFALLRNPDKIIHRLIFDYKGTSKCSGCQFSGQSPESIMYSLLGKLSNASRIHLNISRTQYITSNCQCYSYASFGWQPVIGEAGMIDTNVTFALLNTCNCPIVVKFSFVGSSNSYVLSSWAAIQTYNSVTTTTPLTWSSSSQSLTLSAYSLYLSTYKFSTRYSTPSFSLPTFGPFSFSKYNSRTGKRFPVKLTTVHSAKTAYPTKTKYIMKSIPSNVPCNYMFTIEYDVTNVMDDTPIEVYLLLGFIGKPGLINWISTWKCSSYYFQGSSRKWLQILSPGMYYRVQLSCVPKVQSNGYVKLHFKSGNKCQSANNQTANSSSTSKTGYLAFTSLVYVSESPIYY